MTKTQLRTLRNLLFHLNMEQCKFYRPGKEMDFADADVFTAEVKEGTRLWRESWLIGPLTELIEKHTPK